MKKLARMFSGRTTAYDDALARDDRDAMAAALLRNVRPDAAEWPEAGELAAYVFQVQNCLQAEPIEEICAGKLAFPAPILKQGAA